MRSFRALSRASAAVVAALVATWAPAAQAKKAAAAAAPVVPQLGLRTTNGLAAQAYLGTGKGVTVAVLDGGIDVSHPAVRGSVVASQDFTGGGYVDDDTPAGFVGQMAGHGTGVAGLIAGHDGTYYTGLAPAAKLVNARVTTADDVISDRWVGHGMAFAVKNKAKVMNLSFGNALSSTAYYRLTDKTNLMADYFTERYGVNVVVAAGNENTTAVAQTPGGNYNGYSVGATGEVATKRADYNKVTWFSNYALATDGRSKPDLVAPGQLVDLAAADWEKQPNYGQGTGTSFAAPMVAGVLAQLVGYGQKEGLPTDPLLLKAVVMTGTTKVKKNDGSDWSARRVRRDADYGFRYSQPLDEEQGAGRLDAVGAYRVYAKQTSKSTPLATWKAGKMKADTAVDVPLGKFYAGQKLDATLTWYRHVDYKDKNKNGPDGQDSYWQSADLADFTLTLLKDGAAVAQSDSDVDNVEHLSWTLLGDGNYSLQVYRFDGAGILDEPYAVAARITKGDAASVALAGASARPAYALAADGVLRGGVGAVPEPGVAGMIVVGMGVMLGRRGRR